MAGESTSHSREGVFKYIVTDDRQTDRQTDRLTDDGRTRATLRLNSRLRRTFPDTINYINRSPKRSFPFISILRLLQKQSEEINPTNAKSNSKGRVFTKLIIS